MASFEQTLRKMPPAAFKRAQLRGVVATVFGGTGNVGTAVATQLALRGAQVILPFRFNPGSIRRGQPRAVKTVGEMGQMVPVEFDPHCFKEIQRCVENSHLVVNCIGKGGRPGPLKYEDWSFGWEAVYANLPRHIAMACSMENVDRFVHMSHVNADLDSEIEILHYKGLAERYVREEFPDSTIFRLADVFGTQDALTNMVGRCQDAVGGWWAQQYIPTVKEGMTLIQPVYSTDVGIATTRALTRPDAMGKTFELAGPRAYYLRDMIYFISGILGEGGMLKLRNFDDLQEARRWMNRLEMSQQGRMWRTQAWFDMHWNDAIARGGLPSWEDLDIDPALLNELEHLAPKWCRMSYSRYTSMDAMHDLPRLL